MRLKKLIEEFKKQPIEYDMYKDLYELIKKINKAFK